jgi:hypothetical protein
VVSGTAVVRRAAVMFLPIIFLPFLDAASELRRIDR